MPANARISQLPLATPIAGPELMEIVQGTPQKNVQSTAGGVIGFVATNYALGGNPNAPALNGSFANQFTWWNFVPVAANQAAGITNTNTVAGWNFSGTNTFQDINSLGTTVASSVRLNIMTTAVAAQSAAEWYGAVFSTGSNQCFITRALTNQLPAAGFTLTVYFSLLTAASTQVVFMGFGTAATTIGAPFTPSAATSIIALAKDPGDTTLQFMINNASGTASKTPLAGTTMAAIQGHLLRLSITCDGAGNVAMSLQDLEPTSPVNGGQLYTVSFPTNTAKLPPPRSGTGTNQLGVHFHVNNAAAGGAVALGINYASVTGGFGCL